MLGLESGGEVSKYAHTGVSRNSRGIENAPKYRKHDRKYFHLQFLITWSYYQEKDEVSVIF